MKSIVACTSALKAYQCAEKIRAFIESEYGYEFDRSELLYLSVHINRIVKNL